MTYSISCEVTKNGAKADGVDGNNITITLMNDSSYASNAELKLTADGSAIFTGSGSTEIKIKTDATGKATATLTDTVVEQVSVTMELTGNPSVTSTTAVNFTKINRVVSNIFLLIQEDDAKANGTDENVVAIQAYDEDQAPVPSVDITVTLSNGATFLDKSQRADITTDEIDGTAALQFTNINSGTTKIVAFLPKSLFISNEINANFSEVKPVLQTTLVVTTNNVTANGKVYDAIEATVVDKKTEKPLSGITVTFNIPDGPATFIDGAKSFTNTSDADGKVYARLISSKEGSSTVMAETYTGVSNSVYVDFSPNYSAPEIVRIYNDVKAFSEEGPTVAWPNATFYVQASGGSGDFTWETDKENELKFEKQNDMDAVFVFTSDASVYTAYTITLIDNITKLTTSHTFTLSAFFSSFGEWTTYNLFHKDKFPKLGELTALYNEWGDMSKYPGWLIENGYNYWSNTEEIGIAKAVNLKTGRVNTLLAVLTQCGFAMSKKK